MVALIAVLERNSIVNWERELWVGCNKDITSAHKSIFCVRQNFAGAAKAIEHQVDFVNLGEIHHDDMNSFYDRST